jgi:hypothetical protein
MYNYKVEITGNPFESIKQTETKVFTTKKQALDCFSYYYGIYDIKVFQGAYTLSTTIGREYLIKRGCIFDNETLYDLI